MAEFNLSSFLVGITLFSLFIIGMAIPYGDLGTNYNTTVDTSFQTTYSRIQVIDNTTTDIAAEIRGDGDISTFDAFFLAGKAILSSARIVFGSFGVVTNLVFELQNDFNIPTIFTTAFLTLVLIGIIFSIVSLWARYKS